MKLPVVLDDKYRLERRVGKGSFGEVFQAVDLRLDRLVAVKIISRDCSDPEFLNMFERESKSLATLNHPHVVTVHDFGECAEGPYMVMEYVDGVSLESVVARGPMEQARALNLAVQIADGMAHTHAHDILHRDLSMNNIMLAHDETGADMAKILDFGLVKFLAATIRTRGLPGMGTPSYMAPEQIHGDNLDHRVDIFAFGVGLFRLLHGRFPFESEHPAAIAYLILYEHTVNFDDSLPAELRALITDCLQKDKADRPANFVDVRDRLAGMTGLVVKPRPTPQPGVGSEDAGTVVIPYLRTSKRNPFLNRIMIKSRHEFVGRAKEVRRIYSRIDASHPQSVSIVGERRIGKSSLLNHIYNKDNRREYMANHDLALFAYLDFQRIADFTVPKFVQFLFGVLELETGRDLGVKDDWGLDSLRDALRRIHDEGRRIIILMDEFEVITRNERFEEEFFSFLRSLANSFRVAYVTSSCDELQQLCHNQDISDSPFFNIFSNLPLRAFSRDEARELVVGLSEPEGVSLAPHADRIIELAGCFPFFLQIASCALFEELVDADDDQVDWPRIEATYLDEAAPHYEFLWDHFSNEERINLERIAQGRDTSRKFAFVNEDLVRRGYLDTSPGKTVITSGAFRDFVLRKASASGGDGSLLGGLFSRFRK